MSKLMYPTLTLLFAIHVYFLRTIIVFLFLAPLQAEATPKLMVITNETLSPMLDRVGSEYSASHDTPKPTIHTHTRSGALKAFCEKPAHMSVLATSGELSLKEKKACAALDKQAPIVHEFGHNAFVLVVHKSSEYKSLTKEDLTAALTLQKSTWHDVNPRHRKYPIHIAIPGPETNAYHLLRMALNAEKLRPIDTAVNVITPGDSLFEYSGVFEELEKAPEKIAIVPYSAWDAHRCTTRALSLDGVFPTPETIRKGTYPLTFTMHVYTHTNPSAGVRNYIRELKSPSATGKRGYLKRYGWIGNR